MGGLRRPLPLVTLVYIRAVVKCRGVDARITRRLRILCSGAKGICSRCCANVCVLPLGSNAGRDACSDAKNAPRHGLCWYSRDDGCVETGPEGLSPSKRFVDLSWCDVVVVGTTSQRCAAIPSVRGRIQHVCGGAVNHSTWLHSFVSFTYGVLVEMCLARKAYVLRTCGVARR